MFLLARRLFGPGPALLAAALYVYAPYRLREAYIQGNYGQFTGLAFYPLILWAFHGLITTGRPGYLVAAAVSLAGLLFSHNISFMLFTPVLVTYLLFLLVLTAYQANQRVSASAKNDTESDQQHISAHNLPEERTTLHASRLTPHASRLTPHASRLIPPLTSVIIAVLLGLGLAAIFWLPAFGERHEIQLEGITQGFFDFRENFISLPEFFSPPLPLDLAAINPEFPLSLGLPQIIGAGTGLVSLLLVSIRLIKQRSDNSPHRQENNPPSSILHLPSSILHPPPFPYALFFACFLLLYAFLALPQSQPLWEAVPLLELAEFPWRMLGPAIFCASLLAGFPLSRVNGQWSIANSQSSTTKLTSPIPYPTSHLSSLLSNFYLPTPTDAFAYEVTSGAIGTTSTGEFLPRQAQQHPQPDILWPDYAAGRPPQKIDPATLPSGATVETSSQRSESDTFRIRTPQAFVATIRTLYWPGWQVYLDDQRAAFTVTDGTGLIQTVIPAGEHSLALRLKTTPLRTIGQWLTLGSFVILVIASGLTMKNRIGKSANRQIKKDGDQRYPQGISSAVNGHSASSPITLQVFVIATMLLIISYLLSRPLAPLFTLQSNPDRPQPADQILQVDFGLDADQTPLMRLVGMDSLPSAFAAPTAGEAALVTTLYWRTLRELDANYSVFLHLDAPNGQTFATVDEVHPENIPTRNWPPGLYLRNPLHLKIPADIPPIRYDVNVGIYDRQSAQRLAILPGQASTFNLGSIW
ncbi:MAG: hypothetical protein HYR94_15040, partial [Chloroflexi bacterium]|nr:hypothetical protein [Chloroflexota bacterium]